MVEVSRELTRMLSSACLYCDHLLEQYAHLCILHDYIIKAAFFKGFFIQIKKVA